MSEALKRIVALIPKPVRRTLKALWGRMTFMHWFLGLVHAQTLTRIALERNSGKHSRQLEIGPGARRIPGFETLNVQIGGDVDYVADATRRLPFADGTFDMIYASHVIEHIPWYMLDGVLREWVRVIRPGGVLEVWLPDGLKLAKMLIDVEMGVDRKEWKDGWRSSEATDAYRWINGRLLYGLRRDYPSWHQAIISPGFGRQLLERAGLVDVHALAPDEFRTVDHGWINLGMRGRRP